MKRFVITSVLFCILGVTSSWCTQSDDVQKSQRASRSINAALISQSERSNQTSRVQSSESPSRSVSSRGTTSRLQQNNTQSHTNSSRGTVSARPATPQNITSRRTSVDNNVSERTSRATTNPVQNTRASSNNTTSRTNRVATRTPSEPAIRARTQTIRVSNSTSATKNPVTNDELIKTMNNAAQMIATCKAQYTECMDNFCNVLDDNQGRCSCSKNIKNYAKTEAALKAATESLQDVAQKIQYIGLSADEIETLFDQTEAELAMQGTSDSSQIKTDLDKIKNMIVDIKDGTASSSEISSGISIDLSGLLDFNINSTGFDLSGLFGTQTTNTSSISNQRGEELYKTAASRCKTAVLNSCQSQGVDIAVITNSYDMEIDKQCVAYERSLTDANDQMRSTVRNAQSVLQKARLMVAQQKNSYDLRGCVNALDSCMQDDFVCGTDYENCLDPSGKYIVDGAVVIGSTPILETYTAKESCNKTGVYATWTYSQNHAYCDGSVNDYINNTITSELPTKTSGTLSNFLVNKIGYIKNGRTYGMCISVLDKCRKYTYDNNDKYIANNDVILEYLRRTLPLLKVKQDKILDEYATTCIADVKACLDQNDYGTTNNNIAVNACRANIITCMSVNGKIDSTPNPTEIADFAGYVMCQAAGGSYTNGVCKSANEVNCENSGGQWTGSYCKSAAQIQCENDSNNKWYDNECITKEKYDCITTFGQVWDNGTCKSASQAICDKDPDKKWHDNNCITKAEYNCIIISGQVWDNETCKSANEVNCENSGGQWTGTYCKSANEVTCEKSEGEWTDGSCKCPDGKVLSNYTCIQKDCTEITLSCGTKNNLTCDASNATTTIYRSGDTYYSDNACITKITSITKQPSVTYAALVDITDNTGAICYKNNTFTVDCPDSTEWYYNFNCVTGYVIYNKACALETHVNCYTTGGEWDATTQECKCNDTMQLDPNTQKCVCKDGYVINPDDITTCMSTAETQCTDSGGDWKDGSCQCPAGKVLQNGQCVECTKITLHCTAANNCDEDTIYEYATAIYRSNDQYYTDTQCESEFGSWRDDLYIYDNSELFGVIDANGNICYQNDAFTDKCPSSTDWYYKYDCKAGYTYYIDNCRLEEEVNCDTTSGEWDATNQKCNCNDTMQLDPNTQKCVCKDGYEAIDSRTCKSIAETQCEESEGDWTDGSCQCPAGKVLQDGQCVECTEITLHCEAQYYCDATNREYQEYIYRSNGQYYTNDQCTMEFKSVPTNLNKYDNSEFIGLIDADKKMCYSYQDNTFTNTGKCPDSTDWYYQYACKEGYAYYIDNCRLEQEVNCDTTGGDWKDGSCECPAGNILQDGKCVECTKITLHCEAQYYCDATNREYQEYIYRSNGQYYTNDQCTMEFKSVPTNLNKYDNSEFIGLIDADKKMCYSYQDNTFTNTGKCPTSTDWYYQYDCKEGYAYYIDNCRLEQEVNCDTTGGEWTNGSCQCPAGKVLQDGKCVVECTEITLSCGTNNTLTCDASNATTTIYRSGDTYYSDNACNTQITSITKLPTSVAYAALVDITDENEATCYQDNAFTVDCPTSTDWYYNFECVSGYKQYGQDCVPWQVLYCRYDHPNSNCDGSYWKDITPTTCVDATGNAISGCSVPTSDPTQ